MQTVRRFQPTDAERVAEIFRDATEDLRAVYTPLRSTGAQGNVSQDEVKLVLQDGEAVIGVVELVLDEQHALIQGLAVDRAHRRRGIARALLASCEERARAAGVRVMSLSTIKETGNIAIFLKLGFVVLSEKPAERFVNHEGQAVCLVELEKTI